MEVKTYARAEPFLDRTQAALEANEAANCLMLGICGQIADNWGRLKTVPCLKTVEDEGGLVLAAVMTPPHNLVAYGRQGDLERAARLLVEDLIGEGWTVPGVLAPSQVARAVAGQWAAATGRAASQRGQQRVYKLEQVQGSLPGGGRLRQAGPADLDLVARWRYGFYTELFGTADPEQSRRFARSALERGDIYLWDESQPVSMAMKNRPTSRGISVSLVYTPPELRRRGYATACVGALSRLLLEAGWAFCSLFADLANAAANRLYQRIGYRPVCDYDEYAFAVDQS